MEVDGIDRFLRHELADLDRLCGLLLDRLELLLAEEDVLPLGELVALGGLGAVDGALVFRAEELLLDPATAVAMNHVEADLLAGLGGGEELDRDRHQPEGDLTRCECSRHE